MIMSKVSVVICTHNRPECLKKCVDSILGQTILPKDIVIIDDGCLDGSSIQAGCSAKNVKLKYYWKDRGLQGLTISRNIGVRMTEGEIIVFLDDDVVLDPEYLSEIVHVFTDDVNSEIGGVGGYIIDAYTIKQHSISRIFFTGWKREGKCIQLTPMGALVVRPITERSEVESLSGCNMCYRRSVFTEYEFDEGLYNYALGEDVDFSYRVGKKYKLIIEPKAKLRHEESSTARLKGYQLGKMQTANRRYQYYKNLPQGLWPWFRLQWALFGVVLINIVNSGKRPWKEVLACLAGNLAGLFFLPARSGKRSSWF